MGHEPIPTALAPSVSTTCMHSHVGRLHSALTLIILLLPQHPAPILHLLGHRSSLPISVSHDLNSPDYLKAATSPWHITAPQDCHRCKNCHRRKFLKLGAVVFPILLVYIPSCALTYLDPLAQPRTQHIQVLKTHGENNYELDDGVDAFQQQVDDVIAAGVTDGTSTQAQDQPEQAGDV
ncbi:hypothetical protein C8J57DRAFT_1226359 [Mycena rebaudengoi]|nr:hypothetical protein C8J57DRAFT_1226359 [Mycena rebaudengoi]